MTDKQISKLIKSELKRQRDTIELIPSENYCSPAVLSALGSVLTNKYAEGYPGKRYYGGTNNVDAIEKLAIERAKKLFNAEHANVQPLSGSPANLAVYFALLKPCDTILSMDLTHGGHLTHGHPLTVASRVFKFVHYQTDKKTGLIDYDKLLHTAKTCKPKLILAGFSSYSREIDYKKIKKIANEVGAITMADISHIAGMIAGGVLENPVPLFDVVTTTTHKTLRGPRGAMILCKKQFAEQIDRAVFPGLQGGPHENNIAAIAVALGEALQPSFKKYAKQILLNAKAMENKLKELGFIVCFETTENHLLLLDLTNKNLTGKQAQDILDSVNITCNKNVIPDDQRRPFDPSGIRIGTPAMTTRGFKEKDFALVAELIALVLDNQTNKKIHAGVKRQVAQLTRKYPLYPTM